jgi:tight adherence protein B
VLPFAALALLIAGVGFLAAALAARKRARLERERLASLISGAKTAPMRKPDAFGGLLKAKTNPFDAFVRGLFTIGIRRTWAMRSGSLRLLLTAFAAAGATWDLSLEVAGLSPLCAASASLALFVLVPRHLLSREQKKTERKFAEAFPDAVDTISRMVRAGLPMSAAVRTVAHETPPPVSTVFAAVGDQLRIGVPIEDVLNESSETVGLPDFRFFTIAVALQHETGGNLTQALENLSELMRKRRAARLKAKAATGEIRMTAYTLAAVPVLTVGALLVIQPGYLVPLLQDSRGHVIIGSAVACLLAGFMSMRALMGRLKTD